MRDYEYTGWYYDVSNPHGFYGDRSGGVNDPYPGQVAAVLDRPVEPVKQSKYVYVKNTKQGHATNVTMLRSVQFSLVGYMVFGLLIGLINGESVGQSIVMGIAAILMFSWWSWPIFYMIKKRSEGGVTYRVRNPC